MKTFKIFTEELKKVSGQLGSNPGGIYKDSDTHEQYYMKTPDNHDQAKTEVLSAKLSHLMGIHTTNPELHGKSIKSKFNPNLVPLTSKHHNLTIEHHKQLGKIFAAGVLHKNWDIAGSGIDAGQGNIMVDKKHGHLVSIDQGGSFNFRAQGGHKDYDPEIHEHDSLRDSSMSEGAKRFNEALAHPETHKAIHDSLKNLDMDKVHHLFKNSGLSNHEELHTNFKARHKKLLDKYPE
jgi:hypothetical protein